MTWYGFAIAAGVTWGFTYLLNEMLYRHISFLTSMAIANTVIGVVMSIIVLATPLRHELRGIVQSKSVLLITALSTLSLLAAEIFIALSITGKNATLAGLIEVTYPLFIILFSWLLLHDTHLNTGVIAGGCIDPIRRLPRDRLREMRRIMDF